MRDAQSTSESVRNRGQAYLDKMDAERAEAKAGGPKRVEPYNKGGKVPGRGNKDTVSAKLTPGEVVVKKAAAKKHGAFLSKINSAPVRYRST